MKPIAVFDLDDTLNEIRHDFRRILVSNGFAVPPVNEWDGPMGGSHHGMGVEALQAFMRESNCLISPTYAEGASRAVGRLASTHEIWIVTSRAFHPDAYLLTSNCLRHAGVPFDRLVITDFHVPKGEYLKHEAKRVSFVADDTAKHVHSVMSHAQTCAGFLMRRPWMRRTDAQSAIVVDSVMEAVDHYLGVRRAA